MGGQVYEGTITDLYIPQKEKRNDSLKENSMKLYSRPAPALVFRRTSCCVNSGFRFDLIEEILHYAGWPRIQIDQPERLRSALKTDDGQSADTEGVAINQYLADNKSEKSWHPPTAPSSATSCRSG